MRIVVRELGFGGGVRKEWSTGDMERWVWNRACVCAFVEEKGE